MAVRRILAWSKTWPMPACQRTGNLTYTGCLSSSTSSTTSSSSSLQDPPRYAAQREFFNDNFSALMNWYEEVTGLKEVRLAQKKVLIAEEKFIAAQEARRDVNKQLTVVRDRLKEIYAELDQTSRGEDRYVFLITQENQVLKEERKLVEQFSQHEREERENFSALSSAVKESHEKERAQAERTKYWSVIGSIIGTMIGVAGSSINNEFKMRELRRLVKESAQVTIATRQGADIPKDLLVASDEIKEIALKLVQVPERMMREMQHQNKIVQDNLLELQTTVNQKMQPMASGATVDVDHLLHAQRTENRLLALVCIASAFAIICVTKLAS